MRLPDAGLQVHHLGRLDSKYGFIVGGYIKVILGLYGDNGKENGNYYYELYGWLSKLWSLFGTLNIRCRIIKRDPKRDHNFDNHPYV